MTALHRRKRDALRALAAFAKIPDGELAEPDAPRPPAAGHDPRVHRAAVEAVLRADAAAAGAAAGRGDIAAALARYERERAWTWAAMSREADLARRPPLAGAAPHDVLEAVAEMLSALPWWAAECDSCRRCRAVVTFSRAMHCYAWATRALWESLAGRSRS